MRRTAIDEMSAVLKARAFVSKVAPRAIPVPMEGYLAEAKAIVRVEDDLQEGLLGMSFSLSGKTYICVNGKDSAERQRFTICHEIAHVVLGLPSDHNVQWWSAKRPMAERLCDIFAAELLLPDRLFQPLAEAAPVCLATIDMLAADFEASVTSTGSRYASVVTTPCAFILSEDGKVRYSSRSKALIDARAWIAPRMDLPERTVSYGVRSGSAAERTRVSADAWFSDWERGGTLLEEARHLPKWDQTLSLIWFESEEVPLAPTARQERRWEYEGRDTRRRAEEGDDEGLKELDGNLRWNRRDRYR
jgi:hypothetical protein